MTTFIETDHPRGQAGNAGQFASKSNTAPNGELDEAAASALYDRGIDALRAWEADTDDDIVDSANELADALRSYLAATPHPDGESPSDIAEFMTDPDGGPDSLLRDLPDRYRREVSEAIEAAVLRDRGNRDPRPYTTDATGVSEEVLRETRLQYGYPISDGETEVQAFGVAVGDAVPYDTVQTMLKSAAMKAQFPDSPDESPEI